MWVFGAVFVAISMPWFRSFLEQLFAELTVIFVNCMGSIMAMCIAVFILGVVREISISMNQHKEEKKEKITTMDTENEQRAQVATTSATATTTIMTAKRKAFICNKTNMRTRQAKTLASMCRKKMNQLPKNSWKAVLLLSTLLPVGMALGLDDFNGRNLADEVAPPTLSDNKTAMAEIDARLTTCKYAKTKECVSNPQNVSAFGEYKKGPGICVGFDSAYVTLELESAALPGQYNPISGEEANKQGFKNKFSQWSSDNQEQFQVDCPILYNETIAQGQETLCCTETQYEALQTQVRMIPGLCSSCKENLRNIWCQFTCNPSNSMFLEVNQVRMLPGDVEHKNKVYPAMEEATYYIGEDVARDVYDFCEKDSSFPIMCNPNQNCTDGLGLLKFMGAYKFDTIGSPLQVNFKTIQTLPESEAKEKVCPCDAGANATDCILPMDSRLKSCVGVCGALCNVDPNQKRTYNGACFGAALSDKTNGGKTMVDEKWVDFMSFMEENLQETDFEALNIVLAIVGGIIALALIVGFVYAIRRSKKYASPAMMEGPTVARATRLSACDEFFTRVMKAWGKNIATGNRPWFIIIAALLFVIVAALGLSKIEVETDPVKLWVAENSRSYQERDRFGELFMPFYRTEQILMVPKDGGIIGRKEYIKEAIRVQERVAAVTYGPADSTFPNRVTLDDICWKATGTKCTVNSITQYFQNSMDHFNFYDKYGLAMQHFSNCLYAPENSDLQTCGDLTRQLKTGEKIPATMSDCPCLAAFGAPMNLYNTYLGGFPSTAATNTTQYLESQAFVSTALVYNYYENTENKPAVNWEREFIDAMKDEAEINEMFNIYFMGETSVQDEIEHESSGDILPVALSYSFMIVYVTLGINRWKFNKNFFVTAKFSVGFLGIFCIILSVTSTIGIFMWFGAKLQLVIMEVVPFLTLAIGVDNIFLIVHALDQVQTKLVASDPSRFVQGDKKAVEELVAELISEAVGYIGPSIVMASFSESVAFAFGCISPMPAVLWFAAFSCVAVILNCFLQMTLFLSIVALDKRRELSGRYDVICCIRGSYSVKTPFLQAQETSGPVTANNVPHVEADDDAEDLSMKAEHCFDKCVDAYASFLANKVVKLVVLLVFLLLTLLAIPSIENLQHGLPQAESMPSESYMVDYFNALDKYLATGPPVYFVVETGYGNNPETFDFSKQEIESLFCKSKGFCNDFSIPKIVDALGNNGDASITHFSNGVTYSWMDDFWGFVNPDSECCKVDKNKAYIPIVSGNQSYMTNRGKGDSCLPVGAAPPPVPEQSFMSLFRMFATASAGPMCSYGGGSIYRGQFSIDDSPIPVIRKDTPPVVLNSKNSGNEVTAFSYMIISSANPTQQDYIDSYKQARRAAEWISEKSGVDVWPYSISFVFFDQYLTIVHDTYMLVGLAIAAIFVIHVVYFCGLFYPLVVSLTVINIVIQVMGLMQPLGIMLNGLSVVNLIIAAGVSVEFCSHFARIFAKSTGSGDERAREALHRVMVSVLFGITITKVVGLSALTLADSRIFQKYYFRMYMAIVLCGVLNGLVLLPVVLSVCVDVKKFFVRRKKGDADLILVESPVYQDAVSAKHSSAASSNTRHSISD